MQKADLTSRAVAGFVDLLLIIGLARLPDVLGFLSALSYILARDGLLSSALANNEHLKKCTSSSKARSREGA